jgi:hypothetical protein
MITRLSRVTPWVSPACFGQAWIPGNLKHLSHLNDLGLPEPDDHFPKPDQTQRVDLG